MIELSPLHEYESLEKFLLEALNISKQKIKRSELSKKQLQKKIVEKKSIKLPINLVNTGMINPKFKGIEEPKVLFEDSRLIAISKPCKTHCFPLTYSEQDNILSFLREKGYHQALQINIDSSDRGLLHRLDFETSGLLIYAKEQNSYEYLRKSFHEIAVSKRYYAIVNGEIKEEGLHTHYLKYGSLKNSKGFIVDENDPDGIKVKMEIMSFEYNPEKDVSLVCVSLHEGKRHQLRLQLKAIGHSILGDPLYGDIEEQRMYLHCYEYILKLDNELVTFTDKNLGLFFNFFNFNTNL